ncbi:uracil permease [candidate division KSB3 bacterium]|uniref:Uracil permease n=1 Tax=candidate division KSB3 bacterium TaxID=2044937 RepID=A0A9D5JX57_9BACT|nr:uracil permease [candidate division KSB3 bacterium]MBD3325361.1 uracil permease [candidate division KSB3 bacterium]
MNENTINGKNTIMGLQHMFVMFGATVLVPILTGLDISVALFASGVGTLLFHIVTKFNVPVYLGSSFAFIPAIAAISEKESLSAACGGIVIAGVLYIIVAILFQFISFETIHAILPPRVTGPIIILIGLILAPVAIQNSAGVFSADLVTQIGTGGCWTLAIITFAVGVFVKIYLAQWGFKFLSTLPVLVALITGYLISVLLGIVKFEAVSQAAWIGLPAFSLPTFTGYGISVAVPIAIVTMIEHFGDVLAIGNVVEKDFIRNPGIHRTLIGDGIATSLSAFMGGPANTTYSENTGAVALTGNYNPIVMEIAAVFAILLSVVPKFGKLIGTIPAPVIGGISILLFGMIASIGVKTMVDNRVNLHDPKNLIISSAMLVMGLGIGVSDVQFQIGPINLTGLGLAAIVGILLNAILSGGEREKSERPAS